MKYLHYKGSKFIHLDEYVRIYKHVFNFEYNFFIEYQLCSLLRKKVESLVSKSYFVIRIEKYLKGTGNACCTLKYKANGI